MTVHKELISFDGNEIYELKEEYIENSVKVVLVKDTDLIDVNTTEVGGRFISIEIPPEAVLGDTLSITYKTLHKTAKRFETDRLKALEEKVLKQEELIQELEKALRHRLSIRTFTTWAKSIEKELGVTLIQQSFQTPYPH